MLWPVSEKPVPGTRARILETAISLFRRQGYQRTSVREIAEQLGLTKTAVLYHFSTKADILTALARPLLDDLDASLAEIADPGRPETRWKVIEGVLDVYLAHRHTLQMVLVDLSLLTREPIFHRFVETMTRANHLVAGPRPDLAGRVRAAQAIAMLSDPVILLADAPTGPLRREVLAGVRRLFAGSPTEAEPEAEPETAPRRRAGSGRPSAMSPEMIGTARRMHASGSHTMTEIAATLGVSRATLYRHLSP